MPATRACLVQQFFDAGRAYMTRFPLELRNGGKLRFCQCYGRQCAGLVSGIFIHLSVCARRANRQAWGDTQFAEGLAGAIRSFPGCDAGLMFRGEAPPATEQPAVVLRIVGPHLEDPVPGLPNLLWMISPPNLAPSGLLRRYQAIFCGGQSLTTQLKSLGIPAHYLPQATDVAHFHPDRRLPGKDDIPLAFVGGYAPRVDRWLVLDAVQAGFEPQIWGPGWQGVIPDRLWQGERLGYDELAEVYARSRIILNSHMPAMAMLGFMSNRSYDALAAGAHVISDRVLGFHAPDLPELRMVGSGAELHDTIRALLAEPPVSRPDRIAQHERLARDHSFEKRAGEIIAMARRVLASKVTAAPAFRPGSRRASAPVLLSDPRSSAATSADAMRLASAEILAICARLEDPDAPPLSPSEPDHRTGVIHALMADLREAQDIACLPAAERRHDRLLALAVRARRISEALIYETNPLRLNLTAPEFESRLERVMRNEPLWAHSPDGFQRDNGKISLPLWPRRQCPAPKTPIGVFLHLYYEDLAPVFAAKLANIAAPFRLYVSTNTAEKAAFIRGCLPEADIRVLSNRGRDIYPKLYGFGDVAHQHDIVLHLHGKKSPHSEMLDEWLQHILDCLLGTEAEVNRILSLFETIPRLGMVTPAIFRTVLGAAHWGANQEIARELAGRLHLTGPLPGNGTLRFPVGSMFWARSAAIQPLLDLQLQPEHFPPEAGQIDGTLAHAIERMLGVVCKAGDYHILPVTGAGVRLHPKYQKRFTTNGELRRALETGIFDG